MNSAIDEIGTDTSCLMLAPAWRGASGMVSRIRHSDSRWRALEAIAASMTCARAAASASALSSASVRPLPAREDVPEPDGRFVAPPLLPALVNDLAVPYSRQQAARWAAYPEYYRAGRRGAMDPSDPPSRFHVEYGVPHFDAGEDGTLVRHRLTEVRPGVFIADDGETLDLREPAPSWRGLRLNPVTNGPLGLQWVLLGVVVVVEHQ